MVGEGSKGPGGKRRSLRATPHNGSAYKYYAVCQLIEVRERSRRVVKQSLCVEPRFGHRYLGRLAIPLAIDLRGNYVAVRVFNQVKMTHMFSKPFRGKAAGFLANFATRQMGYPSYSNRTSYFDYLRVYPLIRNR